MKPSPIPENSKAGICIGTYASLPYIELNLACLQRHEPNVKVLVHDDYSHKTDELRALCEKYGADFHSRMYRAVPTVGDLSVFVEGLTWAQQRNLDIVVKCSRRFILNKPWSIGLVELMHNTQYATACAPCAHFGFGFRSEVVAMHVKSWMDSGQCAIMNAAVQSNKLYDALPEAYDHWRARDVHSFIHPSAAEHSHIDDANHTDVDYLVKSEAHYPRHNYDCYAWWTNVMGLARLQPIPGVLWHNSHDISDYFALSQEYGLPYDEEDFRWDDKETKAQAFGKW